MPTHGGDFTHYFFYFFNLTLIKVLFSFDFCLKQTMNTNEIIIAVVNIWFFVTRSEESTYSSSKVLQRNILVTSGLILKK